MASTDQAPPQNGGGLDYPFTDPPGPAEHRVITEGVHWLRVPMPGRLNHINVWLLEDGAGWTVVDTGMPFEVGRDAWRGALKTVMGGRPITRVIVTHMHPDHVGLAGWLCEMFGTELWMSRGDYFMCRTLAMDTGHKPPQEAIRFYRAVGLGDDELASYRENFGNFGKYISPMPQSYRRLEEGERLQIGTREWHIVVGTGHAPEHVCLYCPALNLFISGDQLLPRISSNVSVWPTEPEGNPLRDWLKSCERLIGFLPEDVLVLPAHHDAFRGARRRLAAIIREHEENLVKLLEGCRAPKRAVDVFGLLFKSKINSGNLMPAAGEAVAHLNCLLQRGELTRTDKDGVYWYQARM
jgi:glyoxylase-like metal-dependent hydrolase (beta-lactamase superfamily II)